MSEAKFWLIVIALLVVYGWTGTGDYQEERAKSCERRGGDYSFSLDLCVKGKEHVAI